MGTRELQPRKGRNHRDHPHACGDKIVLLPPLISYVGSSPRVWGQDAEFTAAIEEKRIIPTRVGTSQRDSPPLKFLRDHPHACGDKRPCQRDSPPLKGSSPRVWGQACLLAPLLSFLRIIPTRVGTRRTTSILSFRRKDHPHACGDKLLAKYSNTQINGSSPRVWGQVYIENIRGSQIRIIPTRVGTSLPKITG